jgi:hypothetical protein
LKQEKPNSLQRALGAENAGPHPDANVLTAFAEDALLPREREGVLSHVARCAECREILDLSESAIGPKVVVASPAARGKGTGWRIAVPLLAAAALIAVVSSLVMRYVVSNPRQSITVAKNAEVKAIQPAPPVPAPQPPDSGASTPKEQRRDVRKPAPMEIAPAVVAPPAPEAPAVAANATQAQPEPAPEAGRSDMETARVPMAKPASPPSRLALQAPAQASAFANSVTTHALASASAASIARPHWRINEQGQPERAFGGGAWQPVPPSGSAKVHTLAVFGGEVWAGGEKSQVFRSIDNGISWRIVALPEKDGADHTIAHIRINSAQEITIEASDGTSWATTDGGASWK